MDQVKSTIKSYISKEFLPEEDTELLTDSTPLITGGILDSLAVLNLVAFLEEQFQIEVQAHEVQVENMNTVPDIVKLVQSKL